MKRLLLVPTFRSLTSVRLMLRLLFVVVMLVPVCRLGAQSFVHPGALNTQEDFDRIKAKVAAGEWPWYDSYVTLCNDGLSSLGWWWGPVSQITRGGGGGNNFSRSQKDAIAIYCLALRYRISGDARYAEKAIEGMDRWSSTMTAGPNGDNWGLAAGLCGYEFAVAGETLRGYPGWSQASIDRYKSFLGFFANANINFLGVASLSSRSNWLADNVASLAACGVFCDNADWFNQAINYYKYGRTNGQVHIWAWFMHPEGIVQMEESGRDQAHANDTLATMAVLCEIADHQGIDLYGYDNNRVLRGAEYFAKFNSWVDVPYTPYYNNGGWTKDHWEPNLGYGGRGAYMPFWEMLNAHYAKMGIHAPYTAGYAASRRPSGNVGNWNSPDVLGYDTLTHYQEPPTTDLPPSGLMANFNARQATLSWFGSPRATSYKVKRSTVQGGPYTTIATTNAMKVNYVDDAIPEGQTYYYVVSAMTPSGETANSAEVIGSGCATRYDFEGDASDSVGTFNGTLRGWGASGLPGFTGGHGGGQAISLNGVDQYVELPFGTLTHQDITVSAWIKWSGGNAWQRVFDTGDPNKNRNMYLAVSDGGRMKFYMSSGWHDYDANLYGPLPPLNTWTHVAVTVKSGNATLYQNGVAVDSKSVGTFPLFGQTYTYIGKSLWNNDPTFSGAIDDFRIYNGALSGSEIYALGSTGSNHAPTFVSDPFYGAAVQEYVAYAGQSIYTKASDQDGGPLVFTKLSGPSWLSVAANGALSGTPSKGDVGINRINVRVTDSAGATDDATLYITVNNVNQAPTWASSTITAPSVTRDYSYTGASLAGSASDEDVTFGDSLTFSKISGPAWLTVASNGALSGTPQGSDLGLNTFSVRVTDASGLFADATLNITVLPYALRSQYAFEGNLNDSVSGYTGTASGSPTYGAGRDGSAISLNGSSDFVSLPAAATNFREITIATWVYWNGGSNNQRIFDFGNSTSQYIELCPNTGGGMRLEAVYGGTTQQINYASALPVGRWVHVAVTLGGSGGTLYVDGTAVATNANLTIKPSDFSPQANYIGKSQWSADPRWNGKFDDFRIYNYALSASEIAGILGSIAPLSPSGFSATGGNGSSQITLSWSAAVGATSYNVKRATSPGGSYTTIYSGSATSFADTTGTPGVTYYYIVTAVDAGGESVASNPIAQFANGSAPRTYLRLDESSGTTASDSSGNGWNGTLVGGSTWAAGKINNALSLSGTTNYATIPSGVVAGMTTCTVSAWVKLNSATNNTRIFDFGTGTASYMELCPKTSSNGFMRYEIVSGGTVQQINTTYSFPVGVWTHVAFTLSGSTGTLYINGASVGTNTGLTLKPSNLGTTTLNYIGKSQWSNDPYLNGAVDEFQIYPRALSSTEVGTLAASIPAPTASIAGGDAQATLSWSPVANATGYNIKRSGTSGGPYTIIQANDSGTTFTDTSLINSAGYYYVVTALNGLAESAYSSEVTTTPVGAPPVPTGLQANGADTSVSLTWTSSYGATSYNIYRSLTSGSGYALAGTSTSASYTDTSVTNGTTYFYEVGAVGPDGESASSSEASATPLGLPEAPTGLTATGGNGSVVLTWDASVSATSYNVKSSTTSGSGYAVVATTDSTSFVDTGLSNGTPVYYVVSALNAVGEGSDSSEASTTPIAPPAAPTMTVSSGSGVVGIQWSAVSGATSYTLKRGETSGGPYSVLTTGTATSYFDTSVTNGATYYYVVTAANAGGEGSPSWEAVAKPTANALRVFLRFDEQSGAFAGDSTGNGWNGTLNGATTWAAGKINNAVSLSGSSNYVSLPNGVMAAVTDFTVSAWVKLNTANNTRIFDFGTGTSGYMELCPKTSSNGFMRYEIVSGGTVQQINTTYTFPTGVWTHVALTQSGSTGTLYINGASVGTNSGLTLHPSNLGNTTLNYIGKSQWNDPYLNGSVDEFQIYGRALSASEIGSLASLLAAPTSLTATAGYSQVTCAWGTVAGATSYNLKRAYISGGPYTTLAALTGTTYTDTSTVPESPYYYVVTAASGLVESANSTQATATPLMSAPVISSATTAGGTNGVSFSYQIAGSNFPTSFSASGLPAGLSVNSTTGLISGTPSVSGTFNATIGASNSGGTGNATLTITLQPPAPVINSALSSMGTSGSAFSYTITASNSPTSFAASGLPTGLSINTTSGVISGTPSVTGTFQVSISASNGGGTGSDTLSILLISSSFGAPTGLSATAGVNTVSLAWTPVAGASSYKVKRSLTSGSNYTTVATGLSSPAYSDSGLTNRTEYFYVVSAVTSGGTESSNSSEVGATPMPPLIWIGTGSDANWLTAGNWSSQPVAGDLLSFEGSLQLSNTNNYAANTQFGGIIFNNGSGAFSLNGNAINLAGDIVNNSGSAQTINVNLALAGANRTINTATANLTLAGVISQIGGNYGLIKTGTGELTLSGTNTFAGGVVLNQGYLNAENRAALGTGTLTLAGGTLRNLTGPIRILSNPVFSQPETTSFVRAVATDLVLHGNLAGSGTVDICGTYNAAGMRLSGNNSEFTGTMIVSGPNLRLDAPESASANAAWIVGVNGTGGLQLNAPGTTNTFQLGSLSGDGRIEGHFIFSSSQVQTLSVGALGIDSTFSGSIVDNAVDNAAFGNANGAANNVLALTKVGAGTLTLTGSSSYSGPTIVNEGTLTLNGILSGTSSVTVNGGAAIAGTGTSSGPVTIASGGTIAPGDSGAGTLSVNGDLTLNDGSILNVQLGGTGTSDQIILGTGLVTTGTVTLNVAALSGFGEGTYPVLTGTAVVSAENFAIGTVPAGYACTLSATNGVLAVTSILLPVSPTGLSATAGDSTVSLEWSASTGADSYLVKRATATGGPYTTVASGLTVTTYSDNAVSNGTAYYYVVSAVNAVAESANSAEVAATPLPPVPAAPTMLTATPGNATVSLAWNAAGGADSYNVKRATTSGGPYATLASGLTSTTYNDSGVTNGTTYYYTVTATNLGGESGSSPEASATPVAPPVAPAGLAATSGDASAALVWSPVAEADGYRLKRATTSGGPYSIIADELTGTSFNDTGLTNGTTYYYVVAAYNAGGDSPDSSQVSAEPQAVPVAPTGLAATAISSSKINLAWSAVSGANSYTVKRATTTGGPYTTLASGLTATSQLDTGLTSGTTYYYVVTATSNGGESPASTEASATTTDLRASLAFDETSGTTAADSAGDGYHATLVNGPVFATGTAGNAVNLDGTNDHVTLPSGVVSGLTDFTASVWVKPDTVTTWSRVFDFGTGTAVNMFLTPKNGANGKVRFAITTGGGNGEQRIDGQSALTVGTWSHVVVTKSGNTGILYVNGVEVGRNTAMTHNPSSLGTTTKNYLGRSQYPDPYFDGLIDDFRIYTRALSAAEISAATAAQMPLATVSGLQATPTSSGQINLTWAANPNAASYNVKSATTPGGPYTTLATGVTAASYSNNGLSAGTAYYYVVSASNAGGEGTNSAEASATTIPAAPATLTATTASSTQIDLAWGASTGATSYTVKRSATSGGTYTTLASGVTGTSYSDNGLSAATTYYYVVSASNTTGESTDSAEVAATTVPASPGNVTVTAGDGQATLNWSASTGATGYNVLRATSPNGSYTTVASGLTGTSYLDTGLANGTTYYYAVVATNGSGSSANSTQVNAITTPAAPSGLAATPDNAQVSLLWNPSTGAATYNVLRSATSGSGYATVATGLTGTSYTDTGLTNDTIYYYVVTATNTGGTSANSTEANATPVALPSPWATSDIGTPGATGSASRSPSGVFTVTGAGADIWGSTDAFRYVYQTATGDCDITLRVATLQNTHNSAKAGVMIRESLNANSRHAMTNVTPAIGLEFLRRTSTGGSTSYITPVSGVSAPYWVRLVRSGDNFTSYRSSDGVNWTTVGSVTISMSSNVYIGMLVCSHVNATLCTGTFDNVTVTP